MGGREITANAKADTRVIVDRVIVDVVAMADLLEIPRTKPH